MAVGQPHDEMERHYTPDRLAELCLDRLQDWSEPIVLEPSVGDGAFVRAARRRWPGCSIIGIDIDSGARGLHLVDYAIVEPFEAVSVLELRRLVRELERQRGKARPLISVGNWPFSIAAAHLQQAFRVGCLEVSSILPLAVSEACGQWKEPIDHHQPEWVDPIEGRPWPASVRGTGQWTWSQHPGQYRWRPVVRGWK